MRLSVLDTSPIVQGSTPRQALRNTVDLAVVADRLGYHRYWVPEHHGVRGVASSAPPTLVSVSVIAAEDDERAEWLAETVAPCVLWIVSELPETRGPCGLGHAVPRVQERLRVVQPDLLHEPRGRGVPVRSRNSRARWEVKMPSSSTNRASASTRPSG